MQSNTDLAATISFPSSTTVNNISKLSTNPTTKAPQVTDWIFQDFLNTILEDTQDSLFLQSTAGQNDNTQLLLFDNMMIMPNDKYCSGKEEEEELLSLPDLDDHSSGSHSSSSSSSSSSDEEDELFIAADFPNRVISPPILIESNISCVTIETESVPYIEAKYGSKKKKSTSSLASFRSSFIHLLKPTKTKVKLTIIVSSTTKKIINQFKRHLY